MFRVIIQAGHEGVFTGQTGAPGEKELNVRIRNRLSEILQAKGFQLFLVNANPSSYQTDQDYDLFLALHGDADSPGQGGCVGFADPSIDEATQESQRIAKCVEEEYFKHSGIINNPNKITNNIKFYYMWAKLTAKTPCVLIEMGEVQDPHDSVILADTDRVCNAIARGICKAFGVNWETVETPTIPTLPTIPTPILIITDETKIPQIEGKQVKDIKEELLDLRALVIENKNQIKILGDKIIRGRQALE